MQIVHFKPEDPVAQMDLTADRNNKYTGEDAQDQSHFDLTTPKTNPYPVLGRGQRVQGERERERESLVVKPFTISSAISQPSRLTSCELPDAGIRHQWINMGNLLPEVTMSPANRE